MNALKQKAYVDQEANEFLGLEHVFKELDADSQQRAKNKDLKLEDASEYVRRQITALGGTNELLVASTNKRVGLTSINQAKLAEAENLIVKAIRVSFGNVAAGGTDDPAQINYKAVNRDDLPPAIKGANLRVSQGTRSLFTIPVADLLLDGLQEGTPKENAYMLDNWKIISSRQVFSVAIEFAEGLAVPAADAGKWFIEVRLFGTRTAPK